MAYTLPQRSLRLQEQFNANDIYGFVYHLHELAALRCNLLEHVE